MEASASNKFESLAIVLLSSVAQFHILILLFSEKNPPEYRCASEAPIKWNNSSHFFLPCEPVLYVTASPLPCLFQCSYPEPR